MIIHVQPPELDEYGKWNTGYTQTVVPDNWGNERVLHVYKQFDTEKEAQEFFDSIEQSNCVSQQYILHSTD